MASAEACTPTGIGVSFNLEGSPTRKSLQSLEIYPGPRGLAQGEAHNSARANEVSGDMCRSLWESDAAGVCPGGCGKAGSCWPGRGEEGRSAAAASVLEQSGAAGQPLFEIWG